MIMLLRQCRHRLRNETHRSPPPIGTEDRSCFDPTQLGSGPHTLLLATEPKSVLSLAVQSVLGCWGLHGGAHWWNFKSDLCLLYC